MEVEDAEIDWKEDVLNDPKITLYVDEIPSRSDITFTGSKDEGIWYGEHESGYAEYFYWTGGQQEGFTGDHYELQMEDGSTQVLKGPWSSRAGVINKAGYGPVLDVIYKENPELRGGRAGAVTLEKAEEVVDEFLDGVELERVEKFDANEPYYIPQKVGGDS